MGLSDGTIDITTILKLLEQHSPNAIWNIECKLDYMKSSIKLLENLGYLPTSK